jgi:hypothetical protein
VDSLQSFHLHRRAGSGGWLLFLAVLACLTSTPAAAGDGVTANLLISPEPVTPSVMADFNGDNKLDLATLGTLNQDQIHVQFNAAQFPVFTFLIRPAANHLSARDLDGDNDRDLVLETPLRVPLAVWINDGAGNFQPGDLDKFRFLLSHDDPRSLASCEQPLPSLRTGECPRRSVVLSLPSRCGPESADGKFSADGPAHPATARNFDIWTRGPPRRS